MIWYSTDHHHFEILFSVYFLFCTFTKAKYSNQTSANRGPDSRFILEAIIKALISKSNSSQVIKLMDLGQVAWPCSRWISSQEYLKNLQFSSYNSCFIRMPLGIPNCRWEPCCQMAIVILRKGTHTFTELEREWDSPSHTLFVSTNSNWRVEFDVRPWIAHTHKPA